MQTFESIPDEDVLKYGLPVCKHLVKHADGWRISKRIKGLHKRDIVIRNLVQRKMDAILKIIVSIDAKQIKIARSGSIYFYINGVPWRVSNHSTIFDGNQLIVNLYTDIEPEAIKQVLKC